MSIRCLTPLDAQYPSRLRTLDEPPASLTTRGGSLEAERVVAIVGSRAATVEATAFARTLAAALVNANAVVASGGAAGIDAAAHEAVLKAGGRTWVVAATGVDRCYPREHATLFETVGAGPGAMIWPFGDGHRARSAFLIRNRVLVALADAVVVVQAGFPSGALHAARWASKMRRPLWVVPAAPWMDEFVGSRQLLDGGAHALTSIDKLMMSLGLSVACVQAPSSASPLSAIESAVLGVIETVPLHLETIVTAAHLSVQATAAALLTLALENVLVEGPPGFFRRRDPR